MSDKIYCFTIHVSLQDVDGGIHPCFCFDFISDKYLANKIWCSMTFDAHTIMVNSLLILARLFFTLSTR